MLAGDHYMCKSNAILDFALFVCVTSNNNAAFAFSLENCLETVDS